MGNDPTEGSFALTPNDMTAVNQLENWMSKIDNSVNVCQLSIPGTHDSHSVWRNIILPTGEGKVAMIGRAAPDLVKMFSATQSLDVVAQLHAGVRFLDFRVGGDLNMRHGEVGLTDSLATLLERVKSYLIDKDHPNETVIISIMRDGGPDFPTGGTLHKSVKAIWDTYGWYAGNEWPTLGQVRGKAILFRRFDTDDSKSYGIDGTGFWGQKDQLINAGKWDQQDKQVDNQRKSKDETWSHTWQHLDLARDATNNDVMYFTGLAGSNWPDDIGRFLGLPFSGWQTPEWYSSQLNPNLMQELGKSRMDIQNPQSQRLGIIMLDHILLRECVKIIAKNFEQVIITDKLGWVGPAEVARFKNGINIHYQDDGHLVVYQNVNGSNVPVWALLEMPSGGNNNLMSWDGSELSMSNSNGQYWKTNVSSENPRLRFIGGPPYVMIDTWSTDTGEIRYCSIPTKALSSKVYGGFY